MRVSVPYRDWEIELDIPGRNLVFDLAPGDVTAAPSLHDSVLQALSRPVGTPPLRDLIRPGQRVLIIADDNTRPTPAREIIPLVLNELNQGGIPDDSIKILVASGTHRAMSDAEKAEKFGSSVLGRVALIDHRYKDPAELVDYGTTARGVRISINRHAVEADFRIAVGNVVPHHPAGWGGGAKMMLPGVAGEETVAQMHFLGSRDPALGYIDSPMRREMEDFATRTGLDFIVNTVLNRDAKLVTVVAGHFIEAHRSGVQAATRVYGCPIPTQADLTISSTSPVDFDFFQGDKGITAAEGATRRGGEMVLVSGCIEGVSPAHPDLANYVGRMTSAQVWELVRAGDVADPLTAAEAIVINDIKERQAITLVTDGLSARQCHDMGFQHVPPASLPAYISKRIAAMPDLRLGIIRQSAEIFPFLTKQSHEK